MLSQALPICYNTVSLKYMKQTNKYAGNSLVTWMWQQGRADRQAHLTGIFPGQIFLFNLSRFSENILEVFLENILT